MKVCENCGKIHKRNTKLCGVCRSNLNTRFLICGTCLKEYKYKNYGGATLLNCGACNQRIERNVRKQKLIEIKGGGCYICGYNKCQSALQFHHLVPNEKSLEIGTAIRGSFKKLLKEIDKTILLCANCHAELHAGILCITH